ncbi:MAG: hypothetical protein COA78_24920 [Blastopirellula sp.]|nr:MAG: hypothetical protein COA78_24920 [Blastopirellula sp.]
MNQGRSSSQPTAHAAEQQIALKSYALTGTVFYAFAVFVAILVRLEAGVSISIGSSTLFLAAIAAALLTASLRFSWSNNSQSSAVNWSDYLVAIGPLVCSVFSVALLSEMAADKFAIFLIQCTLVTAECVSLFFMIPPVFFHAKKTSSAPATPTVSAEPKQTPESTPPSPALDITLPQEPPSEPEPSPADENTPTWRFDEPSEPAPHILPQNVTQELTRAVEDGTEVLHGQVRAEFAADQRHESIHVAFCPPLDGIPEVELMQLEGPEVSVKPAVVQPHGARFDLQRSGDSTQAATVVMEFFASVAVGVK